jgi:hypothetical protein
MLKEKKAAVRAFDEKRIRCRRGELKIKGKWEVEEP